MTPHDRFEANLAKSQANGCDTDKTVQRFQQDFNRKADAADRLLQEKQEQELRRFAR